MEDARVWEFERSLWQADPEHYHNSIHEECLMVVPEPPYVLQGQQAADLVSGTPRWDEVKFSDQRVTRPHEGLIVIAYQMDANKADASPYQAHCSSVYLRLGHDNWKVVQHQQTPVLAIGGAA